LTIDASSLPLADAIAATPGKSAKTAPADHQHPRISWAATDHGLVSWTMDVMMANAAGALAAGTLYVCRVHVPVAASVAHILADVTGAGAGLKSGQCYAGLWNASTRALVGATAEQSAGWATTGLKVMALSAGTVNLTAGDYYIGIYANGTTLPSFVRGSSLISGAAANAGMSGNYRVATANTGLAGAPPATLGTLSASGTTWWLALS
jgi:hypothetical protein